MIKFSDKKLQVFVSSTNEDLKVERQATVEAILNAGHIPAGIELCRVADPAQIKIIKEWIDESDVYLLLLGGRYGNIENQSGKSYIHLEYEYALNRGMFVFACVVENPEKRAKKLRDINKYMESENIGKYNEFRELVMSQTIEKWSDRKDLKLSIMKNLQKFANRADAIGWVRSRERIDIVTVTNEIARLSKENYQLNCQIQKLKREKNELDRQIQELNRPQNEFKANSTNGSEQVKELEFLDLELKNILENIPIENSKIIDVTKLKEKNLLYFFIELAQQIKFKEIEEGSCIDLRQFNKLYTSDSDRNIVSLDNQYIAELKNSNLIEIQINKNINPLRAELKISARGNNFLSQIKPEPLDSKN